MNKYRVTLILMAVFFCLGIRADIIPSSFYSEPTAGEFYLYDTTTGKFMGGPTDINLKKPSLSSEATTKVTLTAYANDATGGGKQYFLSGLITGTDNYLKIGVWDGQYVWCDGVKGNTIWTFENGTPDKVYYVYSNNFKETNSEVAGKTMYIISNNASASKPEVAQWALISQASYEEFMQTASYKKNLLTGEKKGDATWTISNADFEGEDVSAWNGGTRTSGQSWRGSTNFLQVADGEATISQTIKDMPAGTYKVVAAVRGAEGTTITAKIGDTGGSTVTNRGYTGEKQINKNGVLMPRPDFGEDFNTAENALGWQWATATATLHAEGELTISFETTGQGFKDIDDIHLYYMSDGSNNYAMEYTVGVDARNHTVSCDLEVDNPNAIFESSWNITTAANVMPHNNLVDNNYINDLVLYDGYDFVAPTTLELKNAVNATLYRNIAAGSYATIVCPFSITGGADGTFYQPSSMGTEYNTLNFESVSAPEAGKAYLYKASNAVTKLTGKPNTTVSTSIISNGTSFTMEGTYSNREKLSQGDYVLSGNSSGAGIYRINSDVSLSPFRAYFRINATASNAAKMAICLDGVPTAITQPKQAEGEKIPYHDLLGRRTGRPAQGMYITKGKTIFAR